MWNIQDYLIDQAGKDWAELLSEWAPILPAEFTVWLVNRTGDIFAVFQDDSVNLLDVGTGLITRLADNREDFCIKIEQADNANNWLAIKLVDQCVARGITLGPNECYAYKIPPLLGGVYEVDNLVPTDLSVHYSLLAQIYIQTRDLPVGTKIFKFVIDN